MIAVISGSTGLVGYQLIQKLLSDADVHQVISVSRRSLNLKNVKLKEVLIQDFSTLSSYQKELRGDTYFCCLGTTIRAAGSRENFRKVDFDAIVEFAKIAKKHNAQKFILISAMGANPNSPILYNRVKGQTEKALQKIGLKSLMIFRPGLLVGHRREFRAAESLFIKAVGFCSHFIPAAFMKKFTTLSEVLAEHMLVASKDSQSGLVVIEAAQI